MKLSASHVIMEPRLGGSGKPFSPAECFTAMRDAGFDSIDVSLWSMCGDGPLGGDRWEVALEELVAAKELCGLPVYQTHADVLGGEQWDDPATDMAAYYERVRRCLIGAKMLGAKWAVVHPYNLAHAPLYNREANREACIAFLAPIIEEGKKAGIGIAVENMVDFRRRHRRYCGGDVYELIELVETINDPLVGICYDTGHGNISGMVPGEAIRAIGKRLVCTHINDNHSTKPDDAHLLPFFGDINWKLVMQALSEIGYQGEFAYEVGPKKVPGMARLEYLKYSVEIGRKLLGMVEQ